jgi:hypothetical protein
VERDEDTIIPTAVGKETDKRKELEDRRRAATPSPEEKVGRIG